MNGLDSHICKQLAGSWSACLYLLVSLLSAEIHLENKSDPERSPGGTSIYMKTQRKLLFERYPHVLMSRMGCVRSVMCPAKYWASSTLIKTNQQHMQQLETQQTSHWLHNEVFLCLHSEHGYLKQSWRLPQRSATSLFVIVKMMQLHFTNLE